MCGTINARGGGGDKICFLSASRPMSPLGAGIQLIADFLGDRGRLLTLLLLFPLPARLIELMLLLVVDKGVALSMPKTICARPSSLTKSCATGSVVSCAEANEGDVLFFFTVGTSLANIAGFVVVEVAVGLSDSTVSR